jgi:hypothetical protein
VNKSNVDQQAMYICDTIEGSQDIHSIQFVSSSDVNKLLKKHLACLCCHYLDGNITTCVNLGSTNKSWDVKFLNSNNPSYVHSTIQFNTYENEWDQLGECGKYLANCLEVGDNFVVNAEEGNEEDVNFYIVLCTQPTHIVAKDYTNPWKTKFKEGDVVVAETYYQKWGSGINNYVFLQNSLTMFMHVSHVRSIKFPMLPSNHRVVNNDHVYILPNYSNVTWYYASFNYFGF